MDKYLNAKDSNGIVASTSYFLLFCYTLLTRNYSYKLLIHFIPRNMPRLYKIILRFFVTKVDQIIVLSDAVKEDVIEFCSVSALSDKICLIHTREVVKRDKLLTNTKIVVSIVGVVNSAKNYLPLLDALSVALYKNIEFKFYCEGIKNYLLEKEFTNSLNNNIVIMDKYADSHEYNTNIAQSDYVFISYSQNYGVRFSGIMFDAIKNGAAVIVNNNKSFISMIMKYTCGFIFQEEEDLVVLLKGIDNGSITFPIFDPSLYEDFSKQNNISMARKCLLEE
jgi:glycosyltransferase involved in cell wall biosynthesis